MCDPIDLYYNICKNKLQYFPPSSISILEELGLSGGSLKISHIMVQDVQGYENRNDASQEYDDVDDSLPNLFIFHFFDVERQ